MVMASGGMRLTGKRPDGQKPARPFFITVSKSMNELILFAHGFRQKVLHRPHFGDMPATEEGEALSVRVNTWK